ncbi:MULTISPECIES: DUF4870 domain-containing protein [Bacillus cereus group]|uniref:DUF4870 domain-containing protein n=1 Tax=Bacillus cereus group TaxID=86661 RepID=UPI0002E29076|nr:MULTISPECIES: DUF4870 domain-containing protein [Bacillus cereus group]MBR9656190.1 DUF4870 domain-containing protein [Bacillus cereus]MCU4901242.1 DUF4870 domain-containing protein [Bacillus cereus]MCU5315745.1 DUF4870 domain-containing protein [Bacillus cereus]MCU5441704.1 DUF4870 domain-containing protein [Bacillus cereus]MCU5484769.1 DUF4870 domain-containing protein [Bacillus cereus]
MNGNKLLSAFSYWSVLFAPILFPVIIWLLGNDETKNHAKRALWTHIIPTIAAIIGTGILFLINMGSVEPDGTFYIAAIIVVVICFIIDIYYFIWNIIKGIKVIKS